MKITIQIEDATPAVLSALSNSFAVNTILQVAAKKAPHGLKKDGTPAKKRGRPAGFSPKKVQK